MRFKLSRRQLVQGAVAAGSLSFISRNAPAAAQSVTPASAPASTSPSFTSESSAPDTLGALPTPLDEFNYDQIEISGAHQVAQRENVAAILTGLNEDGLLKPFREMSGKPGPGASLGGWYEWNSSYDHHHSATGLAPGHCFGQWTAAMARLSVASKAGGNAPRTDLAEKAMRLHAQMADAIAPSFFAQTRFAGYTFDKLACGLKDTHHLLGDPAAFAQLDRCYDAATPSLLGHAIDREVQWRPGLDLSWMWDEPYIIPENLFLLSAMGAGPRYRKMAEAYLLDATYFEPLSRNVNVLGDNHAYSYVNAICSAMQAYLAAGSRMHLQAAVNAFAMLQAQSFVTGGWGPLELLRKPGYDEVAKSIVLTHNSFETPCGAYAHMKLTRYLLRATHDGHYGDSMERVMLNTVLGVLPLQADGRSFYHSDYNDIGKRIYSDTRWPCCAGSLPQAVADYGINSYFRAPGKVWDQSIPALRPALAGRRGHTLACPIRRLPGAGNHPLPGHRLAPHRLRPRPAHPKLVRHHNAHHQRQARRGLTSQRLYHCRPHLAQRRHHRTHTRHAAPPGNPRLRLSSSASRTRRPALRSSRPLPHPPARRNRSAAHQPRRTAQRRTHRPPRVDDQDPHRPTARRPVHRTRRPHLYDLSQDHLSSSCPDGGHFVTLTCFA